MGGPHIARHFSAAGKVVPRGEHFKDAIRLLLPDEAIGTIGCFLARGRPIEEGLDGLIKKMDWLVIVRQTI